MIPFPSYLWHYLPRINREEIFKNGIIGNHNGRWCIYLSHRYDSWKGLIADWDLWKVSTEHLNIDDFSIVDENVDEVLYWGKCGNKICIPNSEIILVESEY